MTAARLSTAPDRLGRLAADWAGLADGALIAAAWQAEGDHFAVVSSFGAESAVLLHLSAQIDPAIPVLFVDTGRLFPETLAYRDTLVATLGLTNVHSVGPSATEVMRRDPALTLYRNDNDGCCALRKVEPLAAALDGITVWASGRKRFQSAQRAGLPLVERDGARLKINPLADWSPERLAEHAARFALPAHPLVAKGYLSIGCAPCTRPARTASAARSGRWAGSGKTECGIHLNSDGRWVRDGSR